ncbi:MAG: YlqD family protein [Vulcanimicrobiota bacterium]
MDSINLKRLVALKVIVTEEFRKQLVDEATQTISRIEDNLVELNQNLDKLPPGDDTREMFNQLKRDREQLIQMKDELEWKIKEVENLSDGAEIPFQMLEGEVSVNVGDDVREKMTKTEILVKDWKVVEIRNP